MYIYIYDKHVGNHKHTPQSLPEVGLSHSFAFGFGAIDLGPRRICRFGCHTFELGKLREHTS